ncbi:MAG: glycosyltransferase, exosortase A system-associated [Aquabacterium sp.]|jgi:PEP-CTERM/exosortase A-associated glycosyltransferase|uniref:TIGR04063 family PEP-CTERM/XrtA system glycosyltransferase n=1 Tax=Aquabacterium sp. TaxID=1872578 RepID=UPI002A366754|nr:TIGR04063 family PEP-CTERM/XrtA system glycosyltransferase [Aquabacterium sp.]MDX9843856.1 glycosyltransferase, exosortase A system-associated [Aquabacterium sp.]
MRILHVLDHSIPLHSGYTFRTAALLREQRALGWETFHVTSPKQGAATVAEETIDGLTFYRTQPAHGRGSNWPVMGEWQLMRALEARIEEVAEQIKPDIIHAHSPVLNAMPALSVGGKLEIPVVYEIRAFWEDAAVDHGTTREGSLRYRLTRGLETSAIRRANHVFTICEGLRADIVARGVAADKVTVIPNAVDVETFQLAQPADPALQEKWGVKGRTVIGFIGSFYAYEGLDLLVAALPEVIKAHPNACLLLVGGGPQEAALKAQVQSLGLSQHVIFTGRVPHAEVNRYYDLIDVLAYPRHSMRLTELVTPLKPLEAMAQGHLFVASDVGGHKELIEHGKTGWLFKADDRAALSQAIVEMLAHPERWPLMKANGREFVESVRNWRNSVANYRSAYEHVLNGGHA